MATLQRFKSYLIYIIPFFSITIFLIIKNWSRIKGFFSPPNDGSNEITSEIDMTRVEKAFKDLKKEYGVDYARRIEQAVRLETAHFKSGQFKKCKTPGMVATKDLFPFGWSSLREYAEIMGLDSRSFGLVYFATTSDSKPRNYIRFSSVYHGIYFFGWFIANKRNKNVAAWYGLKQSMQTSYNAKLDKITPKIV
jgi:hypothetical protein